MTVTMPLGSVCSTMREREGRKKQTGPVGSYANLRQPLPDPPNGEHWVCDASTSEWRLEADEADGVRDASTSERRRIEADETTELVEGVAIASNDDEVIVHLIQPHDTFQGFCLRYKMTPTQLRKAGEFSGENLKFASNPLRIRGDDERHDVQVQNFTKEEKISSILRSCPQLAMTEARCYLDLNHWDIRAAIQNAREDGF